MPNQAAEVVATSAPASIGQGRDGGKEGYTTSLTRTLMLSGQFPNYWRFYVPAHTIANLDKGLLTEAVLLD